MISKNKQVSFRQQSCTEIALRYNMHSVQEFAHLQEEDVANLSALPLGEEEDVQETAKMVESIRGRVDGSAGLKTPAGVQHQRA